EGDLSCASPEQIRGELPDIRSQVFSVAILLFERLTGHHPFGADNDIERQVQRIRRGEMGSGVNHFPRLAAGLRAVLVRAMWPVPEERWPDVGALRERLAAFIEMGSREPRLPGTLEFPSAAIDLAPTRIELDRQVVTLTAQREPVPVRGPVDGDSDDG